MAFDVDIGGGSCRARGVCKLEGLTAPAVKILVGVKGTGPSERLRTIFTQEGLLTSVETLVGAQVVFAREGALADRALKRISGFVGHGGRGVGVGRKVGGSLHWEEGGRDGGGVGGCQRGVAERRRWSE